MQMETQKSLNRIASVLAWTGEHASGLAPVARAVALKAELEEQRDEIESLATRQEQQGGDAMGSVAQKSTLLEALNADLVDIARTARIMGVGDPALPDKFRLPTSRGEQAIAAAGRLFVANATPLKSEFISYGMPANFLDDLSADLSAFESLLFSRDSATQNRMTALAQLDDAIESSARTIAALDAIVRNVFRGDKIALDEWSRAKRVEKVRAHREKPTPAAAM